LVHPTVWWLNWHWRIYIRRKHFNWRRSNRWLHFWWLYFGRFNERFRWII
jgi:hypothetical protein